MAGGGVLWSWWETSRAMRSLYERCQACVRVLGQNSADAELSRE